jgi:hypothetical protein
VTVDKTFTGGMAVAFGVAQIAFGLGCMSLSFLSRAALKAHAQHGSYLALPRWQANLLVASALDDAGFQWLSHYSSVDPLHDLYGIEVCGIHEQDDAVAIQELLVASFRRGERVACATRTMVGNRGSRRTCFGISHAIAKVGRRRNVSRR